MLLNGNVGSCQAEWNYARLEKEGFEPGVGD